MKHNLVHLIIILVLSLILLVSTATYNAVSSGPKAALNSVSNLKNPRAIVVTGKIVKEAIPAEYELGDYWYWFYFDSPFVLEENARGVPYYVEKIMLTTTNPEDIDLDKLNGVRVEAYGQFTYGYAESTVLDILAVTAL